MSNKKEYNLIAVHTIIHKDEMDEKKDAPKTYLPGSAFTVSDKDEYNRLIASGAARSPSAAAEVDELEDEAEQRRLADEAKAKAEDAAAEELAASKSSGSSKSTKK